MVKERKFLLPLQYIITSVCLEIESREEEQESRGRPLSSCRVSSAPELPEQFLVLGYNMEDNLKRIVSETTRICREAGIEASPSKLRHAAFSSLIHI